MCQTVFQLGDLYLSLAVCTGSSSSISFHLCSSMAADTSCQQGPLGGFCMLYTPTEVNLVLILQHFSVLIVHILLHFASSHDALTSRADLLAVVCSG